jgi:nitrite reductase (NADH) large subunit
VSILENSPRLLTRLLDEEGSTILENQITSKEIHIYKSAKIKEILGEERVEYIELEDGRKVAADIVLISAGIRSNLSLLESSVIQTNKGIVVDKYMRTNVNNIFAAGDSAEFKGMVWGIWPVSVEQGKVAGLNSIGYSEEYNEIVPSNLLQIAGMNVFSTGDISKANTGKKYNNGIYTKLFIENGIINGAILMGDTKKGFSIKKAIEEKREFQNELIESDNILNYI